MIEIKVVGGLRCGVTPDNVLLALDNYLKKVKYYGTITLKYEVGELRNIRAEQSFTVDSLIDHLSA